MPQAKADAESRVKRTYVRRRSVQKKKNSFSANVERLTCILLRLGARSNKKKKANITVALNRNSNWKKKRETSIGKKKKDDSKSGAKRVKMHTLDRKQQIKENAVNADRS